MGRASDVHSLATADDFSGDTVADLRSRRLAVCSWETTNAISLRYAFYLWSARKQCAVSLLVRMVAEHWDHSVQP